MNSWQHNVRRLLALRILGHAWVHIPTAVLFFRAHGLSLTDIFVLKAVFSITVVLFEVPSGWFADVVGKRQSLIIGGVFFLLFTAIYIFTGRFELFLLAEFLLGVSQSFISGADSAILFDTLAEADRAVEYPRREAQLVSASSFAEAVGGLLGGWLASYDVLYPFLAQGALLVLFVLIAWRVREPQVAGSHHRQKPKFVDIVTLSRDLLFVRPVLREIMWTSAINATGTFLIVWFAQDYMREVGLPVALFGVAWAFFHVILGIACHWGPALDARLGVRNSARVLGLGVAAGYLLLGLTSEVWGVLFIGILYVVRGLRIPLVRSYINSLVDGSVRATALSINSFLFRLVSVPTSLILAAAADQFGLHTALIVAAGTFLVLEELFARRLPTRLTV